MMGVQCLLILVGHDLLAMALQTPDLPGQNQFSPKVLKLLSAQRQCPCCILPLARDRVDKGSNATPTVAMSHIHHATIAVIHN